MAQDTPSGTDGLFAGRYRNLQLIGTGGMARVYRAEDTALGRTVVLKLLLPEYAGDASFLRRFQEEARTAATLMHPNIVALFDVGDHDGQPFLAMEYVEGRNLKELIQERGPLPVEQAVAIAVQVCAGLEYAHSHGVIHRDIKPQNLLIPASVFANPFAGIIDPTTPLVKIADFGIARALSSARLTRTATVLGSVHYMAPERLSNQPATAESDIYALGVVLYEMLTGSLPFEGDTPLSVMYQHAQTPPPSPRERNPQVPVWLEAAVLKALAKEPGRRFASAAEMRQSLTDGLRQSMTGTVVQPTPGAPPQEEPVGATPRSQPAPERPSQPVDKPRRSPDPVGPLQDAKPTLKPSARRTLDEATTASPWRLSSIAGLGLLRIVKIAGIAALAWLWLLAGIFAAGQLVRANPSGMPTTMPNDSTATVRPNPFASPSILAGPSSPPYEVIAQFYKFLQEGQYREAYFLHSRNFLNGLSYEKWVHQGFAEQESITIDDVHPGPSPDIVYSSVRATDKCNDGASVRRFVQRYDFVWILVQEAGAWRIERSNRVRTTPVSGVTPGPTPYLREYSQGDVVVRLLLDCSYATMTPIPSSR